MAEWFDRIWQLGGVDASTAARASAQKQAGAVHRSADKAFNSTYLQLFQAKRDHHLIEVMVDGDDVVYQSIILELDTDERTLLIDELFPTGFVGLPGQRVMISIRQQQGRRLSFRSEIVQYQLVDDAPVYVLAMPRDLDSDQRRNAYRLPINNDIVIESQFVGPDQKTYRGRVCNLSRTGLSLALDEAQSEAFRREDDVNHLRFDFAGINVDCTAKVRNIEVPETAQQPLRIGAEFVGLSPMVERSLERSILRIQRDRLRVAGQQEANLSL